VNTYQYEGVLFESEVKFGVQRILDFVDAHLDDNAPIVLWGPPVPWKSERRKRHPFRIPRYHDHSPAFGAAFPGETTWRALALWGNSIVPHMEGQSRHFIYWVKLGDGWIPVKYRDAFNECLIVRDLFDGDESACEDCSLKGEVCTEEWLDPMLERLVEGRGEGAFKIAKAEATRRSSGWNSSGNMEEVAAAREPGFVWVTQRGARPKPDDLFFPRGHETTTAATLDLSWDHLDANEEASAGIQEKAAATRNLHNATCGFKKERCLFRNYDCRKWTTWSRGVCTRRWHSIDDVVQAGLEVWRDRYGEIPMEDIQISILMGGHGFNAQHPSTGRVRPFTYRGIERVGGALLHAFYSHSGYSVECTLMATWDEAMRFMRRRAPSDYPWWKDVRERARKVKVKDQLLLMLLEIAEAGFYNGRTLYLVSHKEHRPYHRYGEDRRELIDQVRIGARGRRMTYDSILDLMMDPDLHGWSPWSAFVPN